MRELMEELLCREGMSELSDLLRIKEAWGEIVGPELAARSKPYRLEKKRLSVGAGSHAWAQELHYAVEEVKDKVRNGLGIEIEDVIIKKINLR
jgi:predicted nucleic acid-binding Zn ribbon protein